MCVAIPPKALKKSKNLFGVLAIGYRVGLQRMKQVRELDMVADEEHGKVVAYQIPIPVRCLELDYKSLRITKCLGRSLAVNYGGKTHEDFRLLASSEQIGLGKLAEVGR